MVLAVSFYATAESVAHAGAQPVFANIDPETWCMTAATADAAHRDAVRGVLLSPLVVSTRPGRAPQGGSKSAGSATASTTHRRFTPSRPWPSRASIPRPPGADRFAAETLALPMGPALGRAELERVVEAVGQLLDEIASGAVRTSTSSPSASGQG